MGPVSMRVFPLRGVKWHNRDSTNGFVHRDGWPVRPPSFLVQKYLPSVAASSIIRPAPPVSKFADNWLCPDALSCFMDRSGGSPPWPRPSESVSPLHFAF